MSDSTALARAVVGHLLEQGIREIVLAPGSRNAPLAFAAYDAAGRDSSGCTRGSTSARRGSSPWV